MLRDSQCKERRAIHTGASMPVFTDPRQGLAAARSPEQADTHSVIPNEGSTDQEVQWFGKKSILTET